jgi:SEC-C motif
MTKKVGRNEPCPCGSGSKYKKCHGLQADKNSSQKGPVQIASNEPPRKWNPYAKLRDIEAERRGAIGEIFVDEFAFIDDCLALAARQVEILGDIRPANIEDVAIRDLSCDAFEFLYEARKVIAENRPSVVFPLMRRAFESVSLCHLFMVKPEFAQKWSKGNQFSHGEVRKHLESAPMTESVEQIRSLYQHFSKGTHPNRSHLPYLFLGEGNQFTLGAIPPIDLLVLGDHIHDLLDLCYWYVGVFLYSYSESVPDRIGPRFASEFLKLTPRITQLRSELHEQLAKVREEAAENEPPPGIGPAFFK